VSTVVIRHLSKCGKCFFAPETMPSNALHSESTRFQKLVPAAATTTWLSGEPRLTSAARYLVSS